MLVRDLLLHLNNLSTLHDRAIIVKHKEVTGSKVEWVLLENFPSFLYDCEIDEFDIWYGTCISTVKELEVYIIYKKGDKEC